MQYTAHAGWIYAKVSNPSSATQPVYVPLIALSSQLEADRVARLANTAYADGERNAYTKVLGYVARQEGK